MSEENEGRVDGVGRSVRCLLLLGGSCFAMYWLEGISFRHLLVFGCRCALVWPIGDEIVWCHVFGVLSVCLCH